MQGDCEQDKDNEISSKKNEIEHSKQNNNVIHLPIPIPVFKHYYHLPLDHHYANPIEWQPHTYAEVQHIPAPIEQTLGHPYEHQFFEEPLQERTDTGYLNSLHEHDQGINEHHGQYDFFLSNFIEKMLGYF